MNPRKHPTPAQIAPARAPVKMADCPDCDGAGELYCAHCNGIGTRYPELERGPICGRCKGAGSGDCPTCEGSGQVEAEEEECDDDEECDGEK